MLVSTPGLTPLLVSEVTEQKYFLRTLYVAGLYIRVVLQAHGNGTGNY